MADGVLGVAGAEAALDVAAGHLGARLGTDGPAVLRERAAVLGIAPRGTTSAGGSCRLVRARNGVWIACNLARRSDVELLAAWFERDWDGSPWEAVAAHVAATDAEPAVERAQLLGIPAAVAVAPPSAGSARPVRLEVGAEAPRRPIDAALVVDLSALWAGPLCTRLLREHGARVVKVELVGRPDGARAGDPAFWRQLNAGKEEVTLDVAARAGRDALDDLLGAADVVVTGARPRAVEQLGLDLERRVARGGLVWVSITGYGYSGPWHDRVAFGDDAAVAGGLAVAAGGPDAPVFVGDAPADPLAGMHAAVAVLDRLEPGGGGFVDVSMRDAVGDAVAAATATLA
jgi:hypothetical protein